MQEAEPSPPGAAAPGGALSGTGRRPGSGSSAGGAFERPRVTRLIDSAVGTSGLTLIIAPHVFGKSVAAAQWAAGYREAPILWLDAQDAAGQGWDFYADLLFALSELPGGDGLLAALGGLAAPRPLRRMGVSLLRELHRRQCEAVVVVDHAELLDAEALGLIRTLAERSGQLRLVLLAAELDPVFVLRTQSYGAQVIGVDELRVTPEEIAEAVAVAGLRTESEAVMEVVTTPLMLRSVIQYVLSLGEPVITLQRRQQVGRRLAARSLRRLLAEHSLDRHQKPLLLFSLAGAADAGLLSRLLGTSEKTAATVIADLDQRVMGEWTADGLYRLEESLTHGLAELAGERMSEEEQRRAHRVISVWMQERGRSRDALLHAELAEDWEQIVRIVLLQLHDLPSPRDDGLLEILDRVPEQILLNHPYMGWRRLHLMAGRPDTEYEQLKPAGQAVLKALDPEAHGLWKVMQDSVRFGVLQLMGQFEHADELVPCLLEAAAAPLPLSGAAAERQLTTDEQLMVGAFRSWVSSAVRQFAAEGKLLLGDHRGALELVEPLVQQREEHAGVLSWRSLCSVGLKALILASFGDIRGSQSVLSALEDCALPEAWETNRYGLAVLLAQTYVGMAEHRRETVQALLAQLAPHDRDIRLWPYVYELRSRAEYYGTGGGHRELEEALQARTGSPTSRHWQQLLRGRVGALALAAGDTEMARRNIEAMEAMDHPGRRGATVERSRLNLHMETGEYDVVQRLVQELLDREGLTFREETQARICLAAALHVQGDTTQAARQLRPALNLAEDCGLLFEALHMARRHIHQMVSSYVPERAHLLEHLWPAASAEGRAPALSEAELRVLGELVHTESRVLIGYRLFLSENTVKTHLRQIYRKLGAHSRPEALERAYGLGLIPPDPESEPPP